jgi:hypothetical protein
MRLPPDSLAFAGCPPSAGNRRRARSLKRVPEMAERTIGKDEQSAGQLRPLGDGIQKIE